MMSLSVLSGFCAKIGFQLLNNHGSPRLPVNRVDLATSLLHHKTIRRPDKCRWFRDVLSQFGCVENISVDSILAGSPSWRVPIGPRWFWCWWLLCWRRWCLRRGELRHVAVELEIDHLVVEISMIAFEVEPITVDF